jgi:hypothetical protein
MPRSPRQRPAQRRLPHGLAGHSRPRRRERTTPKRPPPRGPARPARRRRQLPPATAPPHHRRTRFLNRSRCKACWPPRPLVTPRIEGKQQVTRLTAARRTPGSESSSATTGVGSRFRETKRDARKEKGCGGANDPDASRKRNCLTGPGGRSSPELRRYYRVARPYLREISQAIEHPADPRLDKVTASAETVRRMITGKGPPRAGAPVCRLPGALRHGGGRSGRRALG